MGWVNNGESFAVFDLWCGGVNTFFASVIHLMHTPLYFHFCRHDTIHRDVMAAIVSLISISIPADYLNSSIR